MFEKSYFIKPNIEFEPRFMTKNPAPIFRKTFTLNNTKNAVLNVCALGIGYFYINGKPVSSDLFTAPYSNYHKTLWYSTYDISHLLRMGENTIAAILGDGWHNEPFKTRWEHYKATWRDLPKFILQLDVDNKTVLTSDISWKCNPQSAIIFNALRSGEHFDSRIYDKKMFDREYNDDSWDYAKRDDKEPGGVYRQCLCEPIREDREYTPINVIKTGDMRYVFDIGQNISGYVRLTTVGEPGDMLTIRYAEELNEDSTLNLNDVERFYGESEFQTDKFICCGKPFTWSPKFTYHGFRYIEIDGIRNPSDIDVKAVFVHQAIKKRVEFECSDELLNKLFYMGQIATYSNMFYMMTDCPTREKMGWMNDGQSSAEQILTDFEGEKLLTKWTQDIFDAMTEEGALPGIVPTSGWGYEWGNGPVSDGALFELPYVIYKHTGDATMLKAAFPYFEKYLAYLDTRVVDSGFVEFGLGDWANPLDDNNIIPQGFINSVLMCDFYNKATLAAKLCKSNKERYYISKEKALTEKAKKTFINCEGECLINEMSSVAMLIYYDLYDELKPLAQQLKILVEKNTFHHRCGIVGLRRLYLALNKCGLQDYAYKIITADSFPSYKVWMDNGATSLCEFWNYNREVHSKNHHMYSDFMSWIIKTIIGISIDEENIGEVQFKLNPYYFDELSYAKCTYNTINGKISIEWKKIDNRVCLKLFVENGVNIYYKGQKIKCGENIIYQLNNNSKGER